MADSLLPQAPNQLTSLAWLPPDLAIQYEVERFLAACVAGAWFSDVFMGLSGDVFIFRRTPKLGLSEGAYVLSRILTGAFIMSSFIFLIAPIQNCQATIKVTSWFAAFALPCNSLLFFFRAQGAFSKSKPVVWSFLALWLITFASFTTPFAFDATHLGPTRWCIASSIKRFGAASLVAMVAYDSLVFVAVSFKVFYQHAENGAMDRIQLFFTRKGQVYYAITVCLQFIVMVLFLVPSLSTMYQVMFIIPCVALQNAMACRVFRLLKLGIMQDDPTTAPPAPATFANRIRSNVHFVESSNEDGQEDSQTISFTSRRSKSHSRGPIRINIHEETTSDMEVKDKDSVTFAV